jgi:type II secretory pathway pseudopilin PulG
MEIFIRQKKGNVLFLILVAVALFAALSYAVTQSGRGGSGGINRERESLDAAQVVQFMGAVQQAVNRLLLSGCTLTTLNFDTPGLTGYDNLTAPADGSCDIFGPAGGGVTYVPPPSGFSGGEPYAISGHNRIRNVGDNDLGDLVLFLPVVSLTACTGFNARMNLPATTPPDDFIVTGPFTGPGGFTDLANLIQDDGGTNAAFIGARSACIHAVNATVYPGNVGVNYFFYNVLAER